jgi:AcrR family transcriptional regulator
MAKNTREKIIKTAWKLFYEEGFAETTINDIIREADISKGTFYYYFNSKDDLLGTLSEVLDREYERLEGEEPEGLSCFDKLIWLNYEVHSFMEKNIDYRLLAYLYSAQIVKESFSALLNRNRYYYRYVERLMEQGQKNGELTDEMPVSEMVRYFSMGERALVTEWCMNNGTFSLGEFSKRIFPVMMQGLKKA